MLWLKKAQNALCDLSSWLEKGNKIVFLTIKILNGNARSDSFYEDKLQTSN